MVLVEWRECNGACLGFSVRMHVLQQRRVLVRRSGVNYSVWNEVNRFQHFAFGTVCYYLHTHASDKRPFRHRVWRIAVLNMNMVKFTVIIPTLVATNHTSNIYNEGIFGIARYSGCKNHATPRTIYERWKPCHLLEAESEYCWEEDEHDWCRKSQSYWTAAGAVPRSQATGQREHRQLPVCRLGGRYRHQSTRLVPERL